MDQLHSVPFGLVAVAVGLAILLVGGFAADMKPASLGRASRSYRANFYLTTVNGLMLFSIIAILAVKALAAISGGI